MKKHFLSFILLALTLGWSANVLAADDNPPYYLRGINGSWNCTPGVNEFTATSTANVYELTIELTQNSQFKVGNNSWGLDLGGSAEKQKLTIGTPFTLSSEHKNLDGINDYENGWYKFTFNNGSTKTLLVEKVAPDPCPNCKTITKP